MLTTTNAVLEGMRPVQRDDEQKQRAGLTAAFPEEAYL